MNKMGKTVDGTGDKKRKRRLNAQSIIVTGGEEKIKIQGPNGDSDSGTGGPCDYHVDVASNISVTAASAMNTSPSSNSSSNTSTSTCTTTTMEIISELGLTVTMEINNKDISKDIQKHVHVDTEVTKIIPRHFHTRCLLDDDDEEAMNQMGHFESSTSDCKQGNSAKLLLLKLARHVFYKMMSKQNKKKKKKSSNSITISPSPSPSSNTESSPWMPTPIQLQSWPILITQEGQHQKKNSTLNLIGVSPTGSGKSLSYVIPLVLRASLSSSWSSKSFPNSNSSTSTNSDRKVYGLIITPTRELTIQVSKVVALVCKSIKSLMSSSSSSLSSSSSSYSSEKKKKKRKKCDEAKNKGTHNNLVKSTAATFKPISSVAVYGGVQKLEQIQALIGKDSIESESKEKENHNIIVTATPGRLIDLIDMGLNDQSNLNHNSLHDEDRSCKGSSATYSSVAIQKLFNSVQMLIIDEADRVAIQSDISKQVDAILSFLKTNRNGQNNHHQLTLGLFSATLPKSALLKIDEWVEKPRVIVKVNPLTVGSETVEGDDAENNGNRNENREKIESPGDHAVSSPSLSSLSSPKSEKKDHREVTLSAIPQHIEQIVHVCANHKKAKKLMATINKIRQNERKDQGRRRKGLIIVFFAKVKTLQYLYQLLQKESIQCVQLHSKMKQDRREFQLQMFRAGKKNILLATDIAARGIHVNNVEYIINYDFPGSLEQYVHRCGRAGRSKVTNDSNSACANGKSVTTTASMKGPNAVVYSFFHRELAPMAKDVIKLLKNCDAFVDPNLLLLVPEQDRALIGETQQKRKRRRRNERQNLETTEPLADTYNFDSDEQEFAALKSNRIILKRASHVSEADSDSDHS